MDYQILNIIICPNCHNQLFYDKKNFELICDSENIAYPIRNHIPVLLIEEARKLS